MMSMMLEPLFIVYCMQRVIETKNLIFCAEDWVQEDNVD
jgi:hypothetical protein